MGSNPIQYPNYQYIPQQYSQPLFPQPQGSVYMINNSLEVANIPMGAGLSVAFCFPENLCYLKSMQNGNPVFKAYKISPYEHQETSPSADENLDISQILKNIQERLNALETKRSGKLDELL